ncbi:MAG: hypothetical protein Q7U10_00310 [Thermodesulfovibrionia bacterium]|nr:hypothetical protein [Thermodesulfovibrionia bacterium]
MFIGAINEKLRKYFWTHAHMLEGRKCYIGCSGNFTVEQILSQRCKDVEIYSNDVSLYSSAIGHAIAACKLNVEITDPEILWAQKYIDRGGPEMVATFLLLLEMFQYVKRNNDYQERMWQTYLAQWEKIFTKTVDKVNRSIERISIKEYTMIDVHDYFPRTDGVVIGFLPTYVGGYEKLFQKLDESVKWKSPQYDILTTERREATIKRMTEGDYVLYDDVKRELPCIAQCTLYGKRAVYIYSNILFKTGLFRRKVSETVKHYKLLMPKDDIAEDSEVRLLISDTNTVNHYRHLFLSKKIEPTGGDLSILVFAGDQLFGFLIFSGYSKSKGVKDNSIYMLSDFVVLSKYKRLSKLLLMVSKCHEVQKLLQEKYIRRVDTIITTAFTKQPVSMKYRGLYELHKRGEGFLNYKTGFDDTSIKEVTKIWMKRFSNSIPHSKK